MKYFLTCGSGNKQLLEEGKEIVIGRDKNADYIISSPRISSKHASILIENSQIFLKDLDSTNGTFFNGNKILHVKLSPGDKFLLADYSCSIETEENNTEPKTNKNIITKPAVTNLTPLKLKIREELLKRMDLKKSAISHLSSDELFSKTREKVEEIICDWESKIQNNIDTSVLIKEVMDDTLGLGPLEDFLRDETITEIMVNSADNIFIEKDGVLKRSSKSFLDDRQILDVIEKIVTPLGRRIDESSPMVDARLKDGSRVNAIIPPLAINGPCITIRKFSKQRLFPKDLLNFGTVSKQILTFLELAVANKKNIIISGGTGSGKTTLLNIIASYISESERIITIEDAAELNLPQEHIISLESRPANLEGSGQITIRDLVKNALRMRPDRIVVGECRGSEALDMLQAMNTGHDGSLTTGHANSPTDIISRLETMVLMSGMELPLKAIRDQISSAIDIIIQQTRFNDGSRKVTHISEICGQKNGEIIIKDIFNYKLDGYSEAGKLKGKFYPTEYIPKFISELNKSGHKIDLSIFKSGKD